MSLLKRIVGSGPFQRTVGIVGAEYLRLVWMTTRFTMEPEDFVAQAEAELPVIVGVWHGHHFLLPFLRRYLRRPCDVRVLVSRHRDAEINAIAAEHLGVGTIRGSGAHGGPEFTRKGGVGAFRQMLATLQQGTTVALTADIPKISRIAGEGIVRLAALSGRPIYLVAITTRNCIVLDNWDRTEISLPFGRGGIAGRGPFRIAADADAAALESARQMVERELDAATLRARELAGAAHRGLARV
jgi:lysophospholipid acyltransferase (LPLAT)-like uncharacterized protein